MIPPMICREFYKSGYGIMYSANGWVYIWGYKGLFWGANWGTWGRGMINGISFKGGIGDGHHNSYSQQYHLTRHRGYKFQLMYFVFFSCKYYTYRISFQELVNAATNILGGINTVCSSSRNILIFMIITG